MSVNAYDDTKELVETNASVSAGKSFPRWLLLITLSLLNATNACLWITYSSVTDFTELFYNISADQVNYFTLIFPIVCLPTGVLVSYLLDRLGTRIGLLICGILGGCGGAIRYVSCIISTPNFLLALFGQFLAALAQPFCLFAATAVASEFPSSLRATANTLGSMSNPLGILVANLISPAIVKSREGLPYFSLIYFIAAAVAAFVSVINCFGSYWSSALVVETTTRNEQLTFFKSLKHCFTSMPFMLLMMTCGLGIGLFSALSALIEQILCPFGYTDEFSGVCGAVLIAAGLVGAGIAGVIADNSKTFTTLAKICFGFAAIGSCCFAMVTARFNSQVLILISLCGFGSFGFAFYPIGLELGVEATYPVGEAVSTGMLVLAGQLFTVILMVVGQMIAQPMPDLAVSKCAAPPPLNYQIPMFVFAGIACMAAIVFILGFKTSYHRKIAEAEMAAASSQQNSQIHDQDLINEST